MSMFDNKIVQAALLSVGITSSVSNFPGMSAKTGSPSRDAQESKTHQVQVETGHWDYIGPGNSDWKWRKDGTTNIAVPDITNAQRQADSMSLGSAVQVDQTDKTTDYYATSGVGKSGAQGSQGAGNKSGIDTGQWVYDDTGVTNTITDKNGKAIPDESYMWHWHSDKTNAVSAIEKAKSQVDTAGISNKVPLIDSASSTNAGVPTNKTVTPSLMK